MAPKPASKTPATGGKAPAGKAPAEKKEAGKKTAAPTGDKKKRTKTRKETYSSYIYKGNDVHPILQMPACAITVFALASPTSYSCADVFFVFSAQASPP